MMLYQPLKRQQITSIRHLKDSLRAQKLLQRALARSHILADDDTSGKHVVHAAHAKNQSLERVKRLASEIAFKRLTMRIISIAALQIR